MHRRKKASCYASRLFLPISTDGINIEAYYRNIGQNVVFADADYYVNRIFYIYFQGLFRISPYAETVMKLRTTLRFAFFKAFA